MNRVDLIMRNAPEHCSLAPCEYCGGLYLAVPGKRCIPCERKENRALPRVLRSALIGQRAAGAAVARAVKTGVLPKLNGATKCVDCDRPARCYDHRDYSKPLEVEPVCQSCNAKRGPAIYLRVPA